MIDGDDKDPALDDLLRHLGQVEIESGFEQRMLRGLVAKQSQPRTRRSFQLLWMVGSASAVSAAVLLAVFVLKPVSSERHREDHAMRGDVSPQSTSNDLRETTLPSPESHAPRVAQATKSLRRREVPLRTSIPAPASALTRQEMLLLQAARDANKDEIAMLDPEKRELLARKQDAEFERFLHSGERNEPDRTASDPKEND